MVAATSVRTEELEPKKRNSTAHDFEERLKRKVVGQDEAVQAIVDLYQVFCASRNSSRSANRKPVANRPTGRGRRADMPIVLDGISPIGENRQMITT
jgi:hypothetical protein